MSGCSIVLFVRALASLQAYLRGLLRFRELAMCACVGKVWHAEALVTTSHFSHFVFAGSNLFTVSCFYSPWFCFHIPCNEACLPVTHEERTLV